MKNKILFLIFTISTTFGSDLYGQEFNVPYRNGDLWGLSNSAGKILAEPIYDWVSDNQDNNRKDKYTITDKLIEITV